jgi:F420-dependent methylenetetrahydromethanopterin dehydrogenase
MVARAVGGVLAGIVMAFVVVLAVEMIGVQIFPQPAGMDPRDLESVREHLTEIHTGSFVVVIVAWSLAAFTGPVVARRIAGATPGWPPLVVIGLFAALCAYNLIAVPTPRWMTPVAVIAVGAASMLGFRNRAWIRP